MESESSVSPCAAGPVPGSGSHAPLPARSATVTTLCWRRGEPTARAQPAPPCHPRRTAIARGSLPMTLLEFLSRSAPTRLIPPRQLARGRRGDGLPVAAGRPRRGRAATGRLRRLCLLLLLRLFSCAHCHSENCLRDPARDTRLHFLEEAVGLALVGDERVLLAVAAEVDALAELLHRGEMLDPVRVDRAEEDPSLDGAGQLLAELFLTRLVRLLDDLSDAIAQLVLVAELAEARACQVG